VIIVEAGLGTCVLMMFFRSRSYPHLYLSASCKPL